MYIQDRVYVDDSRGLKVGIAKWVDQGLTKITVRRAGMPDSGMWGEPQDHIPI